MAIVFTRLARGKSTPAEVESRQLRSLAGIYKNQACFEGRESVKLSGGVAIRRCEVFYKEYGSREEQSWNVNWHALDSHSSLGLYP